MGLLLGGTHGWPSAATEFVVELDLASECDIGDAPVGAGFCGDVSTKVGEPDCVDVWIGTVVNGIDEVIIEVEPKYFPAKKAKLFKGALSEEALS